MFCHYNELLYPYAVTPDLFTLMREHSTCYFTASKGNFLGRNWSYKELKIQNRSQQTTPDPLFIFLHLVKLILNGKQQILFYNRVYIIKLSIKLYTSIRYVHFLEKIKNYNVALCCTAFHCFTFNYISKKVFVIQLYKSYLQKLKGMNN